MPDRDEAAREFERWHSWGGRGVKPTKILNVNDSDLPETLIGMGKLHELHIEPLDGGHPEILDFTDDPGWAAYDPVHTNQRIYLVLPRGQRRAMRELYLGDSDGDRWHLSALARTVEGRHADTDYPDVMVHPIGVLSHIVYFTEKVGDGLSEYIHEFGEESGHRPLLAVDDRGRLWLASGNYTSPYAGITD